ncbi:MAG: hypothetical protein AAF236_01065 [Verrucomicrobiota bacterium]
MRLISSLVLLSAVITLTGRSQDAIYIGAQETSELMSKEGQKVIVYGETEDSGKSGSGTNFVNFAGAEFYLVTFKSDLPQFPDGEPADLFDGKRIAVTGAISVYQEKPQIKLVSPDQIEILEPDATFPPPAAASPVAMQEEEAPSKTAESEPEKPAEPEEPVRKPPVDASEFFD